ncbi:DUF3095 domain-containing protein [filamentous cyanobacterium CCP5]|nr:DUF3095 domain-containing protein [filamentous cyanobacterium CCP5]
MPTRDFYRSLPVFTKFVDLANPTNYQDIPDDWYVLITDIANSTDAISAGRYKDVNLIGASSIIAVLNAVKPFEVPFIFGGDGATLLVPPDYLHPARAALLGVQSLATQSFGLELRVGTVPVAQIKRRFPIRIAKFRISPHYCQASLMGGGITYATELVKTDSTYRLDGAKAGPYPNLTGLECRWQDIPSPHGHTLSLIVTASERNNWSQQGTYREVLAGIQQIYGSPENYHPISARALKLSFNPSTLRTEFQARTDSATIWGRVKYGLKIMVENIFGLLLMALGITIGGVNWGHYKQDISAASDYQKIDDVLRMVISGTAAQTEQLTQYLEQRFRLGQLVYGIHVSDRALMTCLIIDRQNQHFHLIDSADGGYALAAKSLKQRLHRRAHNWKSFMGLLDRHSNSRPIQKPKT